jgi:dihydrofolate synthase/folylpolyglutamate synthase
MDMLGDTLPLIAFEKAGIIKENVPVIIGEEHPETRPVFENKAHEMNAPIYFASQNIDIQLVKSDFNHSVFDVEFFNLDKIKNLEVDISGDFQIKNVATVLQTVQILKKIPSFAILTEGVVREGLKQVKPLTNFIGRWQIIGEYPTILCDSGHNEGGFNITINQLKTLAYNHLHIVFGVVKDKDLSIILKLLPPNATYYFCKANIPRGLEADILTTQAESYNLKGKAYPSVRKALAAAKRKAQPDDLIFVGGSIFVVAEVL